MNKPITVKELYEKLKKDIAEGRGDYAIALTTDDEGNGYHYCWCATVPLTEAFIDCEENALDMGLDNDIAELDKTILLG